MGGAEFFVSISTEGDGLVLYLIRDPVMCSLSPGLVANDSIALQSDAAGYSPYLPVR